MKPFERFLLVCVALMLMCNPIVFAQTAEKPDITTTKILDLEGGVRISIDRSSDRMYCSTVNGNIYEVLNWKSDNPELKFLADNNDHDVKTQMAGLLAYQGYVYVLGNNDFDENDKFLVGNDVSQHTTTTQGVLMKARMTETGRLGTWEVVMKTELYGSSRSAFNHRFNELQIDPTGEYLYLNSGSRTDHCEVQDNDGKYPDTREVPLTSKILKIPLASTDLELKNNETDLSPYVYCEGIRNSFGLAFDTFGNLFGVGNSGDRDHNEEFNWLLEGKHYGFPWTMGGTNNPQQFSDYDPGTSNGKWSNNPSQDPFVQTTIAWVRGYFHNDPSFPAVPDDLEFMEPVYNYGPHADIYRDEQDNAIKNASNLETYIRGFSPHLSTNGMVFDRFGELGGEYRYNGFVSAFNSGGLAGIFNGDGAGGSILQVSLEYSPDLEHYKMNVEKLVSGYDSPLDVELYDNYLYVMVYDDEGDKKGIHRIELPAKDGAKLQAAYTNEKPEIDGLASEEIWNTVPWNSMDQLYVDEVSGNQNTLPDKDDFQGRFKVLWGENELHILAEIVDDQLDYEAYNENQVANQIFDADALEIFLDENNSGGLHTKTHNAFAFHLSPNGHVADQCGCANPGATDGGSGDWDARLYDDVFDYEWTKDGNTYTWEISMKVPDDTYTDGAQDNSASFTSLEMNQVLGFGIAYNDYDGADREHLVGSFFIEGNSNSSDPDQGGRNVAWNSADAYSDLTLTKASNLTEDCPAPPLFELSSDTLNLDIEFHGTADIVVQLTNAQHIDYFSIEPQSTNLASINFDAESGLLTIEPPSGESLEGSEDFVVTAHSNQCDLASSRRFHLAVKDNVLGLGSDLASELLLVYPNPSNGLVNVELSANYHQIQAELFDMSGRKLLSESWEGSKRKHSINMSKLKTGTYFIVVHADGQMMRTKVLRE